MAVPRALRVLAAAPVLLAFLAPALPAAAADGPAKPMVVLLREDSGTDRRAPLNARRIAAAETAVSAIVDKIRRSDGVRASNRFHHALRGFAAELTPGQLRRLERDPEVEAIVPDSEVELAAQSVPPGVRRVGAVAAPATRIDGKDGSGERIDADVAIIDTGIQSNHPDLNVVGGYNCTTSNRSDWADKQGHGTHVAGTVGALDNGIGVVGTAPGVRLWSVRVFDANAYSRISWIVCGIDWVTSQRDANDPDGARIEVANMSLRDEGKDDANCGYTNADPEHRAICRSVAGGTTYVVAAGNDRRVASLWRPASYNEVITVSAIADFDGKSGGLASATCTSYGTRDGDDTFADFSNYGNDVDITAPGVCVRSTIRGSGYGVVSGTSMASPHVAGAAAVYKALHPTASPSTVRAALIAAGSDAWSQGTDRDSRHEPLLDMSSFGAAPGFELRSTPPSATLWSGYGRSLLDLVFTRGNGFTGDISLSMDGLPKGLSATFSPATLTGWATGPSRLELQAADGTPAGTWDATIVATSGDLEVSRPLTVTVKVDTKAPTVTSPRLSIRAGTTMGTSTAPLRAAWSGSDDVSGIYKFEQQEQRNGGSMKTIGLSPANATSRNLTGALRDTFVERVRGTDRAGNVSAWATASRILLANFTEGTSLATYGGRWSSTSSSSMWGGRGRYATAAGASVTFRFNGQSVAWVATMGPTRGAAKVYVDGVYIRTVDLRASSTRYRQVVFSRDFAEGAHTLRIVVNGTSGRPRVDVDGFLVLRRS